MNTYPRTPDITTAPLHPGASSNYTEYRPVANDVRRRVREDVQAVLNGSFGARCLKVITRDGQSKNFETITGEDGLTFGIKDFTSGTVSALMQAIAAGSDDLLTGAFGDHRAQVLQTGWLAQHTSSANDRGLVALDWFREGLDRLLCQRQLHGLQLRLFVRETLQPSVQAATDTGLKWDFSVAALAGVANSFGGGGMRKLLKKAIDIAGHAEAAAIKELVTLYATREAGPGHAATQRLLARGFGEEGGPLPDDDDLKHSGRRVRALFVEFPWAERQDFNGDFGAFTLGPDEEMA